jgi:hypothetical protein
MSAVSMYQEPIEHAPGCTYGLRAIPGAGERWSGDYPVPAIGDRIDVVMNGFGPGVVVAYFINAGTEGRVYLGVEVRPDTRPDWHVRQNPGRPNCLVFGAETRALEG